VSIRARDLIGRKIIAVDLRRFHTGRHDAPWSTDPILTLDNGRKLYFSTQETEVGEYGVELCLTDRNSK